LPRLTGSDTVDDLKIALRITAHANINVSGKTAKFIYMGK